jgi:integrase
MALYQKVKNGVWFFSIYMPGQRRRLRGSCGTKERAEALLIEQTMRLAATRRTPKAHILKIIDALYADEKPRDRIPIEAVAAEAERIRATRGRELSPAGRQKARCRLNDFARWARMMRPDLKDAREVDRQMAQAYAAALEREGKKAKTRRNIIGVFGAAWNELKRGHDDVENPWPLAMPAKSAEGRGEAYTVEEAQRIFEAGDRDGHGWGLAARVAAATGLRMGDVVTLRHAACMDGAIHVVPRKTARHGIATLIPLPPDLAARIGEGEGYVFPELAEGYRPGYPMRYPFSTVLKMAGVDPQRYTFHSFRHYFRTRLAEAGVSDEIAMKLGGWTQRTTADRYDHDGRAKEKAAAVAAAWALTKNEVD